MKTVSRLNVLCVIVVSFLLSGCQQTKPFWKADNGSDAELSSTSTRSFWPKSKKARLEEDRNRAALYFAMGQSLEQQGETENAIRSYQKAVKLDPSNSLALHRLAIASDRKGENEAAREHYLGAIKIDPENAELHCDFGYNCYLLSNWKEAEDHLRRAIAIKPALSRAHNNLGLVFASTGQNDEALRSFYFAGCNRSEACANLALSLSMQQKWDEAKRYYVEAEGLPTSPSSRATLTQLNHVFQGGMIR